ncbi:MAG: sulfate transporter CysZ [Parahaliea sp.]
MSGLNAPNTAAHCPLCGDDNHCAVERGTGIGQCWCATAPIGRAALAAVPIHQRRRACLCPSCGRAVDPGQTSDQPGRTPNVKGNAISGAGYLLQGASMLTHPRLRLFVLIPLAVNITIFASLIGAAYAYLNSRMDHWLSYIPQWLDFLQWIIWPVIALVFSLVTGYTFTALALIIASPFNSLLAEKAEELVTGREVEGLEGIGAALMEVPRGIVRELAKLIYYVPMALFVLIVSFIPALNAVAPVLWFLLGAWMMSIQFVDYPMDNHRYRFGDVKEAVRSRRLSSLGFGGMVALGAAIPVLNFFVVPSAVVGATLLWCRELAPGSGHAAPGNSGRG